MVKSMKLKLLNKVKSLFLYQFKIPKTIFSKYKVRVYFLCYIDDYIVCYGNKKAYKVFSLDENIIIKNQFQYLFSNIILKRMLMIITFLIISLIFFSSSYFIREIKFKDNYLYDQRVYNFVYNKLNKKLWFYTLDIDITDLNNNLRATFPNYSYIGLTKDNSTLIIDLELINIKKENDKVLETPCDIVSKNDAVIVGIDCKKGRVLVNLNQYVKKGEVLVTGMLNDKIFVESDAVICGKYVEYKKIVVKKEQETFGLTGKLSKKINFKVGNNYLLKFEEKYKDQQLVITKVVSLFKIFEIVNVNYYEESKINISYNYEDALTYAISLIYYDLELYRVSPLEKIIKINLLTSIEKEEEFVFNFTVKQVKNIGYKSDYSSF